MSPGRCTHCGNPWIGGAAWCARCGTRPNEPEGGRSTSLDGTPHTAVPAAPLPMPSMVETTIRLCTQCGIIAPSERGRCERCNTALGPQCPTLARNPDTTAWAWMECWLDCRCGTAIPMTPQSVGTEPVCPTCASTHPLEAAHWQEALDLAHGVIDLSPPDPFGQNARLGTYNPFVRIGVTETFARLPGSVVAAQGPLQSRVTPGLPLCPRCSSALIVRMPGGGRTTTECPQCRDREVFVIPPVLQRAVPSLRTVLAFGRPGPSGMDPWWLLFEGEGGMRSMVADARVREETRQAEAAARAEAERVARAQEAQARAAREAQERVVRAQAEAERRAREAREAREAEARAAWEQQERARLEQERLAREAREEADRRAKERAAREAREEAERQRVAWAAWERAEAERLAREHQARVAWERAEAERLRREGQERRGRLAAWICAATLAVSAVTGAITVVLLR